MSSKCIYYVYAYVRSKDSATAKAGTPYYIGKGCGRRMFVDHGKIKLPADRRNIVVVESHLTELGAWALERRLIKWWGRKFNNTGILYNVHPGAEEGSNHKRGPMPESTRQKLKGPRTQSHKEKISKNKRERDLIRQEIRNNTPCHLKVIFPNNDIFFIATIKEFDEFQIKYGISYKVCRNLIISGKQKIKMPYKGLRIEYISGEYIKRLY